MSVEYFDRDGQPIDLYGWARLYEDWEYRRIAWDEVGEVQVSTVWLGLDHNWWGGSPLIFETMVFGGEHDLEQWRYSSEVEARAGHEMVLSTLIAEREGKKQ